MILDPFVPAFERQGTWLAADQGRFQRQKIEAEHRTFILINRAKLLRARLRQTEKADTRQKIFHQVLPLEPALQGA